MYLLRRGGSDRVLALPLLAVVLGYVLGSIAEGWFPRVDALLVRVVAAVAVGLAVLAISALMGRLRGDHR